MEEKLLIGFSEKWIVPEDRRVTLAGQFHTRISEYIETPCMVNVMAVETSKDQTFICSCDLVSISNHLVISVKEKVAAKNSEIDVNKIILGAIHTHTGPAYYTAKYLDRPSGMSYPNANTVMPEGKKFVSNVEIPEDVLVGEECLEFISDRISDAICEAWAARKHCFCANGFGRASIGYCRRIYRGTNGSVARLGFAKEREQVFREIEGGSDTGIEMLLIYDNMHKPIGVVASVACPSQIVEFKNHVSSDFWGKTRMFLKEYFGEDFHTIGLCSAAGDQSPRDNLRWLRGVEPSMADIEGTVFIGKRLANAIIETFENSRTAPTDKVDLCHKTERIALPINKVSEEEYNQCKETIYKYVEEANKDVFDYQDMIRIHQEIGKVFLYEWQKNVDTMSFEFHFVHFGDMAIATNPFELFLDYGNQIKVRSNAKQTMLIQLANGAAGYLPTAKAEPAGGYGTSIVSCPIGSAGGAVLVEKTLEAINAMFE